MIKCKCGKLAVWHYAPDWQEIERNAPRDYCDDCVPRHPCSCNFNEELEAYPKDEFGRDLPCVEYDYNPRGILTDKEIDLNYKFYDVMLQVLLNDRRIK